MGGARGDIMGGVCDDIMGSIRGHMLGDVFADQSPSSPIMCFVSIAIRLLLWQQSPRLIK